MVQITGSTYTDSSGAVHYRYNSSYIGKNYASGSFRIKTHRGVVEMTEEQAREKAARDTASYLGVNIYDIEGYESRAPTPEDVGVAESQRIQEKEASQQRLNELHQKREKLKQNFAGTFGDREQRAATAPVGAYLPTRQEEAKIKMLQSPTAQWASEKDFEEKVRSVEHAVTRDTVFTGQIVSSTPITVNEPIPPPDVVSPFGKGIIKPENFAKKTFNNDWTARNRNPFDTTEKTETFTVIEGRQAQKYSFKKGKADFGKSLLGKPQGKPEPGATYRKSWLGEYKKINPPKTKTVSKEQFKAIGLADTVAPILTPSGVFTSTAVLKGASLGLKLPKLPKLPQSKTFTKVKNVGSKIGSKAKDLVGEYTIGKPISKFSPEQQKVIKASFRHADDYTENMRKESKIYNKLKRQAEEAKLKSEGRGLSDAQIKEAEKAISIPKKISPKKQIGATDISQFKVEKMDFSNANKFGDLGKGSLFKKPTSKGSSIGKQSGAMSAFKDAIEGKKPEGVIQVEYVKPKSKDPSVIDRRKIKTQKLETPPPKLDIPDSFFAEEAKLMESYIPKPKLKTKGLGITVSPKSSTSTSTKDIFVDREIKTGTGQVLIQRQIMKTPVPTKVENKVKTQVKTITQVKTKPLTLTVPKIKPLTKVKTLVKTQTQTRTKTRVRPVLVPLTKVQVATKTRTQVKTKPLTLTLPQVKTQVNTKTQPLTKTKIRVIPKTLPKTITIPKTITTVIIPRIKTPKKLSGFGSFGKQKTVKKGKVNKFTEFTGVRLPSQMRKRFKI